jgi:hypothetical protein
MHKVMQRQTHLIVDGWRHILDKPCTLPQARMERSFLLQANTGCLTTKLFQMRFTAGRDDEILVYGLLPPSAMSLPTCWPAAQTYA